jgi:23S rRNA pseudouridine1911/1915/1917 synthase
MRKKFELPVLFEDQDVLAVNKPHGVVVNRSQSYADQTVQDWMEEHLAGKEWAEGWQNMVGADFDPQYGSPEEIFADRIGMVHRLDKDTSGVLVLAKNPGALVNLLRQFRERLVTKEYLCLTHGKFRDESGVIAAPIGRRLANRKLFGVVPDGRPAETHFQVLKFYPDFRQDLLPQEKQNLRFSLYQGFSLVSCFPKTGRTHQIRVHLQHIGHPIVGDSVYTGKKRARLDMHWAPRQFLHARALQLQHPRTGKTLNLQAPLLDDLNDVLRFVGEESYNG